MAERIELPQAPNGDPEKQLNTLYSYLYQMAETLNQNLDEIGGGALNDSEIKVMRNILEEGEEEDAVRMAMNEAETLKSLIIKTASWVQNKLEQYRMKLLGEYVAEGTFGKYVRHTGLDVDITPTGIQQNYTFEEVIQGLRTYEINSKNYIKSGLLYTDQTTHLPVYGVAVGKDIVTFSQDGTELYNDQNKVAMFTADELSFWQGGYKATSYKANQIDFYAGGENIVSITPQSFKFLYDGVELMYSMRDKLYMAGDVEIEEGNKLIIDDPEDIEAGGQPVISNIQDDIGDLMGDVTIIYGDINTQSAAITNINSNITTINNNIVTIDNSITTLNQNLLVVDNSITTINNNILSIDNSITVIETAQQALYTEVGNKIAKTSTLQTADAIVTEASRVAVSSIGDTYIAKTQTLQTADAIVTTATAAAVSAVGDTYIAKTTQYQDAASIVSAAETYVNGQLTNYSTTTQTATAISTYVGNALGSYSTTEQTATAISTYVGNALGSYSTTEQTATAISTAVSAGVGNCIAKTETLQTADAIVTAATSAAATAAGDTYIAKTESLQTADAIVTAATSAAATAAGNTYIAKTSTYQTADSIVSAAQTYVNGQLTSYSTTSQIASAISAAVGDCYGKVSGITITSSGVDISASQYVHIASGGNFTVQTGDFSISSSGGYVKAGAWEINNTGLFYYDTDSTDGHVYKFAISNWSAANKHAFTYTDVTSNVSVGIMMVYNSAANKIEISRTANSGQIVLHVYDVHANIFTGGDVYYDNLNQNSSRDIKYDIKPIEQAGERLDELQPVSFKYYNDEKRRTHLGLIYEDTIGIMPEICTVVERDGTKAISYIELVPILLKEIQELRSRVKALEEKEEG